jgi:hypothetical protein
VDAAAGVSEPQREAVAKSIEVPLEPLPCPKGLSAAGQQDRWRELQRKAQRRYPHAEGPVLGAQKEQEQAPHTRPSKSHHSPAPACHGGSAAVIESWKSRYAVFVERYRDSWQKLRGEQSRRKSRVAFPSGGAPPTSPKRDLPVRPWQLPRLRLNSERRSRSQPAAGYPKR